MGNVSVEDLKKIKKLFQNRRRGKKANRYVQRSVPNQAPLYATHTPFSRGDNLQTEILSQNLRLLQNSQQNNNLINKEFTPNITRLVEDNQRFYNALGNIYNRVNSLYPQESSVLIDELDDAGNIATNEPTFHSFKVSGRGIDEVGIDSNKLSENIPSIDEFYPKQGNKFYNKNTTDDLFKTPTPKRETKAERENIRQLYIQEGGNDPVILNSTRKATIQEARYNNLINILEHAMLQTEFDSLYKQVRKTRDIDKKIEILREKSEEVFNDE